MAEFLAAGTACQGLSLAGFAGGGGSTCEDAVKVKVLVTDKVRKSRSLAQSFDSCSSGTARCSVNRMLVMLDWPTHFH
eukprot:11694014-Karenia_brevis.AAC.1